MTLLRLRRRLPALVLVSFAVACGGDGEPSGPEPVAQVSVSATATTLSVGQTAQLTVLLRDAAGNALTGRTVAYSTSSESIATVSSTGVVTAVGPGSATITATSEGRSGTVQVTVQSNSAPTVSAVSPAALLAGQTATITGSNFSTSPSANVVTIGGELAVVTAATATSLTIAVPSALCLPSGSVPVVVTVGSTASAAFPHPVQASGTPLNLPIGELTILQSAAELCLRFAQTAANESYSFGVQSTAESPALLTDVQIASVVTSTAGGSVVQSTPLQLSGGSSAALFELMRSPDVRRWAAHRAVEQRLRQADRELMPLARAAAAERRGTPGAIASARAFSIPSDVAVGDTVSIRVPDLESVCSAFTEIRTVVRVVGERGVWLDDVDNPDGGFELADFQQLSDRFDSQIYQTNVEWFGQPSDLDNNERIVIVATKEVNKQGEQPPLGFVTGADFLTRSQCASSDLGEIYYGRSADPAGEFGPVYSDTTARQDAVRLIAHEFTHIIQFGRRVFNDNAQEFLTVWELEGQATLAEEVNGHAANGLSERQNYGFDVAWSGFLDSAAESAEPWYANAFFDLIIYFGLNFDGNEFFKTAGAPEECSWLGDEDDGNTGPCVGGREVYGVPWSFLRFLTDHYAPAIGGGPAFQRAIIDGTVSGFPNVVGPLGIPIPEALARWSAALWIDDRYPGMEETITLLSWDLIDAVDEGIIDPGNLQPRARTFSSFSDTVSVRGGSTAYFTISGATRPATYVRMRRPDGGLLPAQMQVWVVRTR